MTFRALASRHGIAIATITLITLPLARRSTRCDRNSSLGFSSLLQRNCGNTPSRIGIGALLDVPSSKTTRDSHEFCRGARDGRCSCLCNFLGFCCRAGCHYGGGCTSVSAGGGSSLLCLVERVGILSPMFQSAFSGSLKALKLSFIRWSISHSTSRSIRA
jgi:hypothetical protein